jgi:hypothetical protein
MWHLFSSTSAADFRVASARWMYGMLWDMVALKMGYTSKWMSKKHQQTPPFSRFFTLQLPKIASQVGPSQCEARIQSGFRTFFNSPILMTPVLS